MTKRAAGEARNTAAPASSCGSAQRPAGVRFSTQAVNSALRGQRGVHLGAKEPRRDRVDLDVVRRELDREAARQHRDAALAGLVRHRRRPRQARHQRADVDDLAGAPRLHRRDDGARHVERRVEVGRHQAAPVGVAELDDRRAVLDAGVVDEDVDRRRRDACTAATPAAHRVGIGDVERAPISTARPSPRSARGRGLELGAVAAVEDDARAGRRRGRARSPGRGPSRRR